MTKAEIKEYNGYPAISINGEIYPPMMMTIVSRFREKIIVDQKHYQALGEAGIRIFFIICDSLWTDTEAVSHILYETRQILEVVPNAWFFLRIGLHPTKEWLLEHPDEIVRFSDGSVRRAYCVTETVEIDLPGMYSLCSEKWRETAGEYLIKTVDALQKTIVSDHIVGIFFAAGGTSEWYYMNPTEDYEKQLTADFSPAFAKQFRKYMDEKYGPGQKSTEIPSLSERFFAETDRIIGHPKMPGIMEEKPKPPSNGTNYGTFLDLNHGSHAFDFYRAWHLGTADSIIYFGSLVKKYYPDLLTGSFYGAWGWNEFLSCSNVSGVLRILDSGKIDLLANPGVYENRQPGGFTGQREMADSFRLRNTIFVVEEDTCTHAENAYFRETTGMYTLENTLEVMKRDFGRNLSEDLQAWWFDQHAGGKRFKGPEIYALLKRQQDIMMQAYMKTRKKCNEIAMIYDEETVCLASLQTTRDEVEMFRAYEIARVGAGIDQYYHNDLSDPRMPDYKLYIFCNTCYLTDAERESIRRKLKKNHAVAVFMYGAGLMNPDRKRPLDTAYIEELTGIRVSARMEADSPKFIFEENVPFFGSKIEEGTIYGILRETLKNNDEYDVQRHCYPQVLYPVLYADDPDADVLARFCASGTPAVALKNGEDFLAVYYGAKLLNAEILREIARMAGCHIWEENGNVVYVSKNYLTVHASRTGTVTISLPYRGSAREVYEDRFYAKDEFSFSFFMKYGTTRTFELNQQ
mgnify:CR=1 FL=1